MYKNNIIVLQFYMEENAVLYIPKSFSVGCISYCTPDGGSIAVTKKEMRAGRTAPIKKQ